MKVTATCTYDSNNCHKENCEGCVLLLNGSTDEFRGTRYLYGTVLRLGKVCGSRNPECVVNLNGEERWVFRSLSSHKIGAFYV